MIANADPSMFEEDSFAELRPPKAAHDSLRKDQILTNSCTTVWVLPLKKFRTEESARFMSLLCHVDAPSLPRQSVALLTALPSMKRSAPRAITCGARALCMGEVLIRAFSKDLGSPTSAELSVALNMASCTRSDFRYFSDRAARCGQQARNRDGDQRRLRTSLSKLALCRYGACKDLPWQRSIRRRRFKNRLLITTTTPHSMRAYRPC